MPALAANRVGGGPLHATILDLVRKPEHRGDAGKRGGPRPSQPPICLEDDPARVAAALPSFLHNGGTVLMVGFSFILCIDRLAMSRIGRPLLGDQGEGGIVGCWPGGRNGCGSRQCHGRGYARQDEAAG
jgi:hypothetical protein